MTKVHKSFMAENSKREKHEKWISTLEATAHAWEEKYVGIDAEEAFSELLVAYAEALEKHEEGRGNKFASTFFWFQRKALAGLLEERDKQMKYGTVMSVDECLDEDDDRYGSELLIDPIDHIGRAIDELSAVELNADVKAVLDYYLLHEVQTDKYNKVGAATIARDISEHLGWGYRRARRAGEALLKWWSEGVAPVAVAV